MDRRTLLKAMIGAPISRALPWSKFASLVAPISPATAASISMSLSEIVQETIRKNKPALIENIQANNALMRRIKERED